MFRFSAARQRLRLRHPHLRHHGRRRQHQGPPPQNEYRRSGLTQPRGERRPGPPAEVHRRHDRPAVLKPGQGGQAQQPPGAVHPPGDPAQPAAGPAYPGPRPQLHQQDRQGAGDRLRDCRKIRYPEPISSPTTVEGERRGAAQWSRV